MTSNVDIAGEDYEFHSPRPPKKADRSRLRRTTTQLSWITITLIVILIAARLALPYFLHRYVNNTLSKIPDYIGQVGEIDVHLWRGAYKINGIELRKKSGKVSTPFFACKSADLSVQWKELFNGAFVGEIEMDEPQLNFVFAKSSERSQTWIDESFQDRVQDLFPLKINKFETHNGEIHFRKPDGDPPVDVRLTQTEISATNITNSLRVAKTLQATMFLSAKVEQEAPIKLKSRFDPYARVPTFDLDLAMTSLELIKLNDFFRSWGNFDVESGTMSVYAELTSGRNGFRGYVKPLLEDVHMLSVSEDSKNPFKLLWEGAVAAVVELFTNQRRDQFAARIPFEGTFDNPQSQTWTTIVSIISNAFIKALRPAIEDSVSPAKE